jgi:hypothetical protein
LTGERADAVTAPARQIEPATTKHKGTYFSCITPPTGEEPLPRKKVNQIQVYGKLKSAR